MTHPLAHISWIGKDLTAADAHVPTALGAKKPKKRKKGDQTSDLGVMVKGKIKIKESEVGAFMTRQLQAIDDEYVTTPFPYDALAMAGLGEDQKHQFLDAVAQAQFLDTKTVKMRDLFALEPKVSIEKLTELLKDGEDDKFEDTPPCVVLVGDRMYIADGHHRLTVAWLLGDDKAEVAYYEVSDNPSDLDKRFDIGAEILKVDESLGLVLGWAIVSKKDGEDYFDLQGDHIPEDAMLRAAVDFMQHSRMAKEMHEGDSRGSILFAFPLTTDIAKAFGVETKTTGLLIAMKPDSDETLQKFRDGTYTGFSIGGYRLQDEDV
jgi:Putative phage serine protease XkdF